MPVTTESQLEAIHAMMDKGQRSVRIEPHTLIAWGFVSAGLILFFEYFLPLNTFPERWQHHVFETITITVVLALVGIWDYRRTRAVRRRRDETISFVQKQVTKIWWFLIGLVIFINLGMNFFGGGFIFFPLVLVILGLALYVQGLFSQTMIAWIGIILIAAGFLVLALNFPPKVTSWLAIFVLGLGFPALAYCVNKPFFQEAGVWQRAKLALAFVLLVSVPWIAVYHFIRVTGFMDVETISLSDYADLTEDQLVALHNVRINAGSEIPIHIEIQSAVLQGGKADVRVPLKIADHLDLAVKDEHPTGFFRIGDGAWQQYGHTFRLRVFEWKSFLTRNEGPKMEIKMKMSTHR